MHADSDELGEARQALRDAEAALEYALEREKALIADQRLRLSEIAHELRSPLTAVAGFAELTINKQFGPVKNEKYKDYARHIHQASRMMLDIIESMAGEQTAQDEPLAVPLAPVDAGEIIDGIVDLFSDMAEQRGVTLKAHVADDFPLIETNATRLNQVLINLVSNAIKFTPEGGNVEIQAHVDPDSGAVILVIQDDGAGMTEQEMVHALQPCEKGRAASPHGDLGSGLGLAIVDRLIRELGDSLEVRSEKGKGTVVRITLAASERQRPRPARTVGPQPFRKMF